MIDLQIRSFHYRSANAGASPWATPSPATGSPADTSLGASSTSSPVTKMQGQAALHDVELSIPGGSVTLLCGPSGGGKSTLLRLMNGMIPHFHPGTLDGSVSVNGVDPAQVSFVRVGRDTSTVFQNPRTQFFTTHVADELAFRGENYGQDPHELRDSIQDAVALLDATDLLSKELAPLSGGELQKVACVQAMVAGTPIIFMDEPTSNLSPASIQLLRRSIEVLRAAGRTIVIAEHRLSFLRGLIDHAHLVAGGTITHSWTGSDFFTLSDDVRRGLGLRSLIDVALPGAGEGSKPEFDAGSEPRMGTPDSECTASKRIASGLTVKNLRHYYWRRLILDIDHVHFPAGQVTALVGANGAGKTTLSRILTGLLRAQPYERPHRFQRGAQTPTFFLDGASVSEQERLALSAMVFQDVNRQLFSASVLDEVMLSARTGFTEADAQVLLDEHGLTGLEQRHPQSLSGGQKQRLAISCTRSSGARIHVWDEPTSGVDAVHLQSVANSLRSMANAGHVVVVVTHDPELVHTVADLVYELKDGQLQTCH